MADKNVHEGHRQRLKRRARAEGFRFFNPHQIVELLLFYTIPRKDTSETAHLLINRFGTLRGVLLAPKEELVKVKGIGERSAEWLNRMGELIEAYVEVGAKNRPQVSNYRDALELCIRQMSRLSAPASYSIALTPTGKVQMFDKICDSTAWGEADVLKNSLRRVLAAHARNVIIVEYLGTESVSVQAQDCTWANAYAQILQLMGVELLDVLLVGKNQSVSLNQSGNFDRGRLGDARSVLSERYLMEDPAEEVPEGGMSAVDEDL